MEIVDHADHRLIRLAGRLTSAQVHELLEASRTSPAPVRLNLGELRSVDSVGLEVLHDLHVRGALLSEVPAYIQLKLDSFSAKRKSRH
jgi:anti-anti-sigma regulatory factor